MRLEDLIKGIDGIIISGDMETEITSVDFDSRKVTPGSLFVAVRGYEADGNTYVADAVKKGAVVIVTDEPGLKTSAIKIVAPDARKALAVISDRFHGSPQNSLIMTGVTGTNGKTTTSYMVKSIFDASGLDCGLIGTIKHIIGSKTVESINTTPESYDIHSLLARMVTAGQNACIMEVSSHALALSRVYGIRFRAVAFTNITRDHLDFHEDFNNYLNAKMSLFSSLSGDSTAVINLDDPNAGYFINASRGGRVLSYGFGEKNDIHPVSYELRADGTSMTLQTPSGTMNINLQIPGKFNISNAMAAAGIAVSCGLPNDSIVKGLESLKSVKGRYEIINEGQNFTVIIDYAHTPDALERILTSAREITKGRLISVFGCGGDRDRGKRPIMGEISTKNADLSIITSDNPRTENPDVIIEDILKGVSGDNYKVVADREKGIIEALGNARANDTVVIAGKGHEDYQIIGKTKHHFDDAEIVRNFLRSI